MVTRGSYSYKVNGRLYKYYISIDGYPKTDRNSCGFDQIPPAGAKYAEYRDAKRAECEEMEAAAFDLLDDPSGIDAKKMSSFLEDFDLYSFPYTNLSEININHDYDYVIDLDRDTFIVFHSCGWIRWGADRVPADWGTQVNSQIQQALEEETKNPRRYRKSTPEDITANQKPPRWDFREELFHNLCLEARWESLASELLSPEDHMFKEICVILLCVAADSPYLRYHDDSVPATNSASLEFVYLNSREFLQGPFPRLCLDTVQQHCWACQFETGIASSRVLILFESLDEPGEIETAQKHVEEARKGDLGQKARPAVVISPQHVMVSPCPNQYSSVIPLDKGKNIDMAFHLLDDTFAQAQETVGISGKLATLPAEIISEIINKLDPEALWSCMAASKALRVYAKKAAYRQILQRMGDKKGDLRRTHTRDEKTISPSLVMPSGLRIALGLYKP